MQEEECVRCVFFCLSGRYNFMTLPSLPEVPNRPPFPVPPFHPLDTLLALKILAKLALCAISTCTGVTANAQCSPLASM